MGIIFLAVSAALSVLGIVFRAAFYRHGHGSSVLFWVSVIMFIVAEAAAITALCVLGCSTAPYAAADAPVTTIFGSGVLAFFNWLAVFFSCLDEP